MQQKRSYLCVPLALAYCTFSLPTMASVLFSDLGAPGDVYNSSSGWNVEGSGTVGGTSFDSASLFTAAGVGALSVTEIDLAVSLDSGPGTFDASIWTDSSGTPGTQLDEWSLSTANLFGSCCDLVSVTGITGLTLTGTDKYFLILEPVSSTDDSDNVWNKNNKGTTGVTLSSSNGGATWTNLGAGSTLAAFDVLSDPPVPEPGTWFLFAAGAGGLMMRARYTRRSR